MFDAKLQPVIRRAFAPPARWLTERGVSADSVSVLGFAIGMLAVPALALGAYGVGLALILANRIADGLDGALAREAGGNDRGAFLDIALDMVFYGLVPLGFALGNPDHALPAAVLLAAFIGTGSSFLAFAAIAGKRGMSAEAYPTKGIYYLGGLTEGAETIAVFTAMCLFPSLFPVFAWGFAALCALTTLTRWIAGWRSFG